MGAKITRLLRQLNPTTDSSAPFRTDEMSWWAMKYLKTLCKMRMDGDYRLQYAIEKIANKHCVSITDNDWVQCNHIMIAAGSADPDVCDPRLSPFIQALTELYYSDKYILTRIGDVPHHRRIVPSNSTTEFIPKFEVWANSYLKNFWQAVICPSRYSYIITNRKYWNELKEAFYLTGEFSINFKKECNAFDKYLAAPEFGMPGFDIFKLPLMLLYKRKYFNSATEVTILNLKEKLSSFESWANIYLCRLYQQVIVFSKDPEKYNQHIRLQFIEAARDVGEYETFKDLSVFRNYPINGVPFWDFADGRFVAPLARIYERVQPDIKRLNGLIAESERKKKNSSFCRINENQGSKFSYKKETTPVHVPNDIFDAPAEVLDVVIDPITLPSKIGTVEFKQRVIKALTSCLKKDPLKLKYIAGKLIAKTFGVNHREFEDWAKDNLECYPGVNSVNYWGLPKFENMCEGDEMADEDEVQDGTVVEEIVLPPEIGSTEFDSAITQFLSDTEQPVWRTGEAICKSIGYEADKCDPLDVWFLAQPEFVRRIGKGGKNKYYALLSRVKSDEPVETKTTTTTDHKKNGKNKTGKPAEPVVPRATYTPDELMAFGMLFAICDQCLRTMHFYANRFAIRHPEAFAQLTLAEKHLRNGVALMKDSLKINDRQLPTLEDL